MVPFLRSSGQGDLLEAVPPDRHRRPRGDGHDRRDPLAAGQLEVHDRAAAVETPLLQPAAGGQVPDQLDQFGVRAHHRRQASAAAVGVADEDAVAAVDVDVLDLGVGQQRFQAGQPEDLVEHRRDHALLDLGRAPASPPESRSSAWACASAASCRIASAICWRVAAPIGGTAGALVGLDALTEPGGQFRRAAADAAAPPPRLRRRAGAAVPPDRAGSAGSTVGRLRSRCSTTVGRRVRACSCPRAVSCLRTERLQGRARHRRTGNRHPSLRVRPGAGVPVRQGQRRDLGGGPTEPGPRGAVPIVALARTAPRRPCRHGEHAPAPGSAAPGRPPRVG